MLREAGAADYSAHCEGVHQMFSLPNNSKSTFLKSGNGSVMGYAGYLGHELARDFNFPQFLIARKFSGDFRVFANRILNIREGFFFGCAQ